MFSRLHQISGNSPKSVHCIFFNTGMVIFISVQLEIDNGDELTDEFLYDEVHPKQHAHKQAFAKPRGPAGKRGHKRLIKGTGETVQNS